MILKFRKQKKLLDDEAARKQEESTRAAYIAKKKAKAEAAKTSSEIAISSPTMIVGATPTTVSPRRHAKPRVAAESAAADGAAVAVAGGAAGDAAGERTRSGHRRVSRQGSFIKQPSRAKLSPDEDVQRSTSSLGTYDGALETATLASLRTTSGSKKKKKKKRSAGEKSPTTKKRAVTEADEPDAPAVFATDDLVDPLDSAAEGRAVARGNRKVLADDDDSSGGGGDDDGDDDGGDDDDGISVGDRNADTVPPAVPEVDEFAELDALSAQLAVAVASAHLSPRARPADGVAPPMVPQTLKKPPLPPPNAVDFDDEFKNILDSMPAFDDV